MDIFRDQIDRIVYDLRKTLDSYTDEYGARFEPEDGSHLVCCRNNGKDRYYCSRRESGRSIRKSIDKDQDAINALARKEYLKISIASLRNNINVIEAAIDSYEDLDFDTILRKMYKAYRGLPETCFLSNDAGMDRKLSEDTEDRFRRHREWAKEPYEKSDYNPEGRKFPTSAGFRVRSKSEQHIVEKLTEVGVPFRYEQVIRVNEKKYSADFTFRDMNGDLFYWEHAGMMNNPVYVESYYRKMDVYERIGIVPWKNLIITYDVDGVINVPLIKSIIEHDVIPRL